MDDKIASTLMRAGLRTKAKEIIRLNDRLWSRIIAHRFSQRCLLCGQPGCDAHHWLYRRGVMIHRWTISNGVYVCRPCHEKAKDKFYTFIEKIVLLAPELGEWRDSLPTLQVVRIPYYALDETYHLLEKYCLQHNIPTER